MASELSYSLFPFEDLSTYSSTSPEHTPSSSPNYNYISGEEPFIADFARSQYDLSKENYKNCTNPTSSCVVPLSPSMSEEKFLDLNSDIFAIDEISKPTFMPDNTVFDESIALTEEDINELSSLLFQQQEPEASSFTLDYNSDNSTVPIVPTSSSSSITPSEYTKGQNNLDTEQNLMLSFGRKRTPEEKLAADRIRKARAYARLRERKRQEMTAEQRVHLRETGRIAARKSRVVRKARWETMMRESSDLDARNTSLNRELQQLNLSIAALRQQILKKYGAF